MTTAGFDQPLPILPQDETERGGADFQDRVSRRAPWPACSGTRSRRRRSRFRAQHT